MEKQDDPGSTLDKVLHYCKGSKVDPIFILILILATYVRAIKLTDSGFYTDEAREALLAQQVLHQDLPMYAFAEGQYIHLLITKLSFAIFGVSEMSARLPTLVFAIGTIALVMYMSSEMFGDRRISYLAGFLMAISAWHIKWSIILRPYSLLMMLAVAVVYLTFKAIRTERPVYYYLSGALMVISLFTSRFSLVLVLVLVTYYAVTKKLVNKHLFISTLPPLLLGSAIGMYLLWRGDFDIVFEEVTGAWWSNSNPSYYIILILDKLTIVALIVILAASYWVFKGKKMDQTVVLIMPLVYLVMLSFFFTSKQDRYLSVLIPFLYILIAIGTVRMILMFHKKVTPSKVFALVLIFLVCAGDVAMFTPARPIHNYRENYTVEWRECCEFVEENMHEGDYILATVDHPVEFYLTEPNASLVYDWDEAVDIIWGTDIRQNSTIWLIADKGRFHNTLESWQQDWIWENLDMVYETEHNYVFNNSVFDKAWRVPLNYIDASMSSMDIVLSTEEWPAERYLGIDAYSDWYGMIDLYNTSFMDAVWLNGVPDNATVWFLVEKNVFYHDYEYWQREWIWENFDNVWESEHVILFKSSKFDKVWKQACDQVLYELAEQDLVLSTQPDLIDEYMNTTIYSDWDETIDKYGVTFSDAIWQKGLPQDADVWFIADKDTFYNDLEFWQRDWLYRNFDITWESQFTYVFKGTRFDRVWKEACDKVNADFNPGDILLSTESEPVENYLGITTYSDWSSTIVEYNITFEDAMWHDGVPNGTSVWFIAEKHFYYNNFDYWQRDWFDRNFIVYWESDHTLVFINEGSS